MKLSQITLILVLVSFSIQMSAQKCPVPEGKHLINTDEAGNNIAMEGYDLVQFFANKKEKGNFDFKATHQGIDYLFVSETNKNKFEANPKAYLPVYGGFCAVAAYFGKAEELQTYDIYEVVDGKLYFNKNSKAEKIWKKNPKKIIKKADYKWPCIVEDLGLKIDEPYIEPKSIK